MLVEQLRRILKADAVLDDSQTKQLYGRDWTKFYTVDPTAIVFAESTEDVQKIVQWARQTGTALVPSGGRTGLSGAAVASHREVVVSFERMNRILDFNPIDQTVTVQAGVVTEALQNYVREQGYFYPVDFAAKGSSQIGGNIATNAGGVKVVRYGSTREWVAGLKVVTGHGEILDLNRGLIKNATGYDFRHLFIGSEGTLGFITEATLKVTRPPQEQVVMILGVASLQDVMKIFREFRKLDLTAFEMFSHAALMKVREHAQLGAPLQAEAPFYVLIEFELTQADTIERALEIFENSVAQGSAIDGVISQNEIQARSFWRYREDISESLAPYTPYKNDISVTISQVPAFLEASDALLKKEYPHFEVIWFGHIGDGNLHINILKPSAMSTADFVKTCQQVDSHLFSTIQRFGGSISAEHGVGLTKKPFLHYARSAAEIELMKGIKACFDPDGILNPGKIF
jgi:glycolate oxidase subunit GlcD